MHTGRAHTVNSVNSAPASATDPQPADDVVTGVLWVNAGSSLPSRKRGFLFKILLRCTTSWDSAVPAAAAAALCIYRHNPCVTLPDANIQTRRDTRKTGRPRKSCLTQGSATHAQCADIPQNLHMQARLAASSRGKTRFKAAIDAANSGLEQQRHIGHDLRFTCFTRGQSRAVRTTFGASKAEVESTRMPAKRTKFATRDKLCSVESRSVDSWRAEARAKGHDTRAYLKLRDQEWMLQTKKATAQVYMVTTAWSEGETSSDAACDAALPTCSGRLTQARVRVRVGISACSLARQDYPPAIQGAAASLRLVDGRYRGRKGVNKNHRETGTPLTLRQRLYVSPPNDVSAAIVWSISTIAIERFPPGFTRVVSRTQEECQMPSTRYDSNDVVSFGTLLCPAPSAVHAYQASDKKLHHPGPGIECAAEQVSRLAACAPRSALPDDTPLGKERCDVAVRWLRRVFVPPVLPHRSTRACAPSPPARRGIESFLQHCEHLKAPCRRIRHHARSLTYSRSLHAHREHMLCHVNIADLRLEWKSSLGLQRRRLEHLVCILEPVEEKMRPLPQPVAVKSRRERKVVVPGRERFGRRACQGAQDQSCGENDPSKWTGPTCADLLQRPVRDPVQTQTGVHQQRRDRHATRSRTPSLCTCAAQATGWLRSTCLKTRPPESITSSCRAGWMRKETSPEGPSHNREFKPRRERPIKVIARLVSKKAVVDDDQEGGERRARRAAGGKQHAAGALSHRKAAAAGSVRAHAQAQVEQREGESNRREALGGRLQHDAYMGDGERQSENGGSCELRAQTGGGAAALWDAGLAFAAGGQWAVDGRQRAAASGQKSWVLREARHIGGWRDCTNGMYRGKRGGQWVGREREGRIRASGSEQKPGHRQQAARPEMGGGHPAAGGGDVPDSGRLRTGDGHRVAARKQAGRVRREPGTGERASGGAASTERQAPAVRANTSAAPDDEDFAIAQGLSLGGTARCSSSVQVHLRYTYVKELMAISKRDQACETCAVACAPPHADLLRNTSDVAIGAEPNATHVTPTSLSILPPSPAGPPLLWQVRWLPHDCQHYLAVAPIKATMDRPWSLGQVIGPCDALPDALGARLRTLTVHLRADTTQVNGWRCCSNSARRPSARRGGATRGRLVELDDFEGEREDGTQGDVAAGVGTPSAMPQAQARRACPDRASAWTPYARRKSALATMDVFDELRLAYVYTTGPRPRACRVAVARDGGAHTGDGTGGMGAMAPISRHGHTHTYNLCKNAVSDIIVKVNHIFIKLSQTKAPVRLRAPKLIDEVQSLFCQLTSNSLHMSVHIRNRTKIATACTLEMPIDFPSKDPAQSRAWDLLTSARVPKGELGTYVRYWGRRVHYLNVMEDRFEPSVFVPQQSLGLFFEAGWFGVSGAPPGYIVRKVSRGAEQLVLYGLAALWRVLGRAVAWQRTAEQGGRAGGTSGGRRADSGRRRRRKRAGGQQQQWWATAAVDHIELALVAEMIRVQLLEKFFETLGRDRVTSMGPSRDGNPKNPCHASPNLRTS
ncbi:hypothetical protein GGX14DRAFT_404941 [Mycena pura]|uniref:Uncharacterized protein n=1 Tax=Mycena pura TaxID=153505 RepID=A0AAD6Y137_9AGAR|nr:hypothetical protein GGX14DRAFT_404941 [Mycena pura]